MDLASLPMYDFPELRAATDRWYEAIRVGCERRGLALPAALERNLVLDDLDLFPRTALTQTCGYPLVSHQRGKLRVVATPVYSCDGCSGPSYSSCVVVRASGAESVSSLDDLRNKIIAKNSIGSMSGDLLCTATLGEVALTCTEIFTGAHVESLRAVREGRADAATIDCVSFALLARTRPAAVEGVRVLQQTLPALALPYCTSSEASDETVEILREALRDAVRDPALKEIRETLLIADFAMDDEVSEAAYLACVSNLKKQVRMTAFHAHTPPPQFPAVDRASVEADFPLMGVFARHAQDKAEVTSEFAAWSVLDDGRSIRVVLPFRKELPSKSDAPVLPVFPVNVPVCTVFFMGRRLRCHETLEDDLDVCAKCWEADAALVSKMSPDIVRCYSSGQRSPGGDWGNMVALRFDTFDAPIEELNRRPWHCVAVENIAPHYYRYVRLHRAIITQLEAGKLQIQMVRTLALNYQDGALASRTETKWDSLEHIVD